MTCYPVSSWAKNHVTCRCYTLTWTKRSNQVVRHSRRTTSWRREQWDASLSVWLLSGQETHLLHLYSLTCTCFHLPLPVLYVLTCLSICRFSTSFAYYGLAMDLQKFGVSHLISMLAAAKFLYISLTWYLRFRYQRWERLPRLQYLPVTSHLPAEMVYHHPT